MCDTFSIVLDLFNDEAIAAVFAHEEDAHAFVRDTVDGYGRFLVESGFIGIIDFEEGE